VPDLTNFYAQYAAVKPWLQARTPAPPDRERPQSQEDQEKIDRPRPASCAPAARLLPSYWWNTRPLSRPAALLAAYRWIIDFRDEATGERLDDLEDPFRLYRCHTIMNCTEACPKDLNPAKAIAEIKKMMIERTLAAMKAIGTRCHVGARSTSPTRSGMLGSRSALLAIGFPLRFHGRWRYDHPRPHVLIS
jgi:succinate dehydrogenase/fumarate reductase-like Fe-S protein